MPNLDLNNIYMLVLWIIPGFISIKVWSMVVATTKKKASEIVIECVIASFFNSIIYTIFAKYVFSSNVVMQTIWFILGIFIVPIIWPFILKMILNINWISNLIINPVPKGWDKIFSSGERFFVIIHMKDGKRIGGFYGENSYVSSYPEAQDIYIESAWKLKKKDSDNSTDDSNNDNVKEECIGSFECEIEGSRGLWISKDDFTFIEFFEVEEE